MPFSTPSAPLYKTGKAGTLGFGSSYLFIKKWSGKITKVWADATDSSGYDIGTQQLWRKQAAGSIAMEGTIEGFYDFNGSSAGILLAILSDANFAAQFNFDAATPFATGFVSIEDFDTGIEVEGGTTIGFSCAYKSYGIMTLWNGGASA